jgi:hypothetical protein
LPDAGAAVRRLNQDREGRRRRQDGNQAKQGDQACNQHNYDAGMDQLRQALQQVGLKPAR